MNRNIIYLVIVVFFAVLVSYFVGKNQRLISPTVSTPRETQLNIVTPIVTTVEEKRLDTDFVLNTPRGKYQVWIRNDEIWIYEIPDREGAYGLIITKAEYPKLFKQGIANMSSISIKLANTSNKDGINIILDNTQPDHGENTATYRLTIDPETGKIVVDSNGDY